MRKTIGFLYICLSILPVWHAVAQVNQVKAKVRGVLLDPNDACIVGGTITFGSQKTKLRVYSNDEGLFEAQLPVGVYQLDVESRGFKRFQIKALELKPPGLEDLKIHLEPEPVDGSCCPILGSFTTLTPEKAPIADIKARKIE